ncbi:hypothetical protein MACK_000560 [Theileria orientalis]|uniref:Nrap protein domain-containing protein n=1 Tax=Theileria orientalis TaxID=68886 RepID=A0A976MA38_THEOR|nr:hypothetical protein MACK_000560 [Theileria orientalis]
MNNKRIKRKKISKESTDSTSSQSIDEEDVLKIIKRYKLDINDNKSPYSTLIKLFLGNLNGILDDLIEKKEVESYDIFGGYRYGYLLVNDTNIDILVKIYNNENFTRILNYIKGNLCKLNTANTKETNKDNVNIYVLNNKNVSSNLLNKELAIEVKRSKKEFNFKLYFTIVKYDRKRNVRKVNINEYLIEKLDEIHRKYVNISNAIVLIKLFLQSHNLDKIQLNVGSSCTSLNRNDKDKVEVCRTFCTSELNGHVFNLLLTHLCTINNYSENVKSIILFKNVLTFIVNRVTKESGALVYCEHNNTKNNNITSVDNLIQKKEDGVNDRSYETIETVFNDEIKDKLVESDLYEDYVRVVNSEFSKRISLYTQKYVEVDLFKQVELTFPQLVYYCKIGLAILNGDTSKVDKVRKLFLQRNYLSNFYEHYLFIRTDNSNGIKSKKDSTSNGVYNIAVLKQLLHLLRYVFKERLYLMHLYFIKKYSTDDTGNNNNNSNVINDNNDRNTVNYGTGSTNNINEGVMIYFTFNHNIQGVLDYGPKYTMNTTMSGGDSNREVSNFENKIYEYIWGDNYQLVKTNNIIQYTVNLSKINANSDIGTSNITTNTASTTNTSTNTTSTTKSSRKAKETDEQVLLLREWDENLNYRLLRYVLNNLVNKKLSSRVYVNINNLNVRYPFISEYQKDLISTTNDFTDILTSLEYLPLKILNIQIINETYSYLNLYSPKVGNKEGASDYRDLIKVVVKWEYSNKWPNEELAYNNVVTSLFILISKELKHRYRLDSKFKERYLYVEYGDYTYQLIHYRHNRGGGIGNSSTGNILSSSSNSSFGSMISVISALSGKNSIGNVNSSGLSSGSIGVDDTIANLEYEYVLNEKCRNEVMKNISFINCVKLMKIFMSKYVKVDMNNMIKLLALKAYEDNSIKSESSIVQFLQILYSITHNSNTDNSNTGNTANIGSTNTVNIGNSGSTTNIANTGNIGNGGSTTNTANTGNTNNIGNNVGDDAISNIFKNLSNDVVKKLNEYSGILLKEINNNLQSIPANTNGTSMDEERLNTLLSNDWNYDMIVKLHNPVVNKSISTLGNYDRKKYIEYLLKYYKEYLGELGDMYYYKYKLYSHFNTKTHRHLNLYFKFNKFNFVPRLNYKSHKYPQSIIMPSTHYKYIHNISKDNNLIDAKEHSTEEDVNNVIVVPNSGKSDN